MKGGRESQQKRTKESVAQEKKCETVCDLESLEMLFSFALMLFSLAIDLCAHLDIQVCCTTTFLSTHSLYKRLHSRIETKTQESNAMIYVLG